MLASAAQLSRMSWGCPSRSYSHPFSFMFPVPSQVSTKQSCLCVHPPQTRDICGGEVCAVITIPWSPPLRKKEALWRRWEEPRLVKVVGMVESCVQVQTCCYWDEPVLSHKTPPLWSMDPQDQAEVVIVSRTPWAEPAWLPSCWAMSFPLVPAGGKTHQHLPLQLFWGWGNSPCEHVVAQRLTYLGMAVGVQSSPDHVLVSVLESHLHTRCATLGRGAVFFHLPDFTLQCTAQQVSWELE